MRVQVREPAQAVAQVARGRRVRQRAERFDDARDRAARGPLLEDEQAPAAAAAALAAATLGAAIATAAIAPRTLAAAAVTAAARAAAALAAARRAGRRLRHGPALHAHLRRG